MLMDTSPLATRVCCVDMPQFAYASVYRTALLSGIGVSAWYIGVPCRCVLVLHSCVYLRDESIQRVLLDMCCAKTILLGRKKRGPWISCFAVDLLG